jgi:hypothetical protein
MITYREALQIAQTNVRAFVTRFKTNRVVAILSLATAISLSGAVYFYAQSASFRSDPQMAVQEETDKLIAAVGQLIALPEGEVPTIATVTDPAILKNQPFFARAVKGDKVLIYTNSKKAILYDPVNHKLREVGPLDIAVPN